LFAVVGFDLVTRFAARLRSTFTHTVAVTFCYGCYSWFTPDFAVVHVVTRFYALVPGYCVCWFTLILHRLRVPRLHTAFTVTFTHVVCSVRYTVVTRVMRLRVHTFPVRITPTLHTRWLVGYVRWLRLPFTFGCYTVTDFAVTHTPRSRTHTVTAFTRLRFTTRCTLHTRVHHRTHTHVTVTHGWLVYARYRVTHTFLHFVPRFTFTVGLRCVGLLVDLRSLRLCVTWLLRLRTVTLRSVTPHYPLRCYHTRLRYHGCGLVGLRTRYVYVGFTRFTHVLPSQLHTRLFVTGWLVYCTRCLRLVGCWFPVTHAYRHTTHTVCCTRTCGYVACRLRYTRTRLRLDYGSVGYVYPHTRLLPTVGLHRTHVTHVWFWFFVGYTVPVLPFALHVLRFTAVCTRLRFTFACTPHVLVFTRLHARLHVRFFAAPGYAHGSGSRLRYAHVYCRFTRCAVTFGLHTVYLRVLVWLAVGYGLFTFGYRLRCTHIACVTFVYHTPFCPRSVRFTHGWLVVLRLHTTVAHVTHGCCLWFTFHTRSGYVYGLVGCYVAVTRLVDFTVALVYVRCCCLHVCYVLVGYTLLRFALLRILHVWFGYARLVLRLLRLRVAFRTTRLRAVHVGFTFRLRYVTFAGYALHTRYVYRCGIYWVTLRFHGLRFVLLHHTRLRCLRTVTAPAVCTHTAHGYVTHTGCVPVYGCFTLHIPFTVCHVGSLRCTGFYVGWLLFPFPVTFTFWFTVPTGYWFAFYGYRFTRVTARAFGSRFWFTHTRTVATFGLHYTFVILVVTGFTHFTARLVRSRYTHGYIYGYYCLRSRYPYGLHTFAFTHTVPTLPVTPHTVVAFTGYVYAHTYITVTVPGLLVPVHARPHTHHRWIHVTVTTHAFTVGCGYAPAVCVCTARGLPLHTGYTTVTVIAFGSTVTHAVTVTPHVYLHVVTRLRSTRTFARCGWFSRWVTVCLLPVGFGWLRYAFGLRFAPHVRLLRFPFTVLHRLRLVVGYGYVHLPHTPVWLPTHLRLLRLRLFSYGCTHTFTHVLRLFTFTHFAFAVTDGYTLCGLPLLVYTRLRLRLHVTVYVYVCGCYGSRLRLFGLRTPLLRLPVTFTRSVGYVSHVRTHIYTRFHTRLRFVTYVVTITLVVRVILVGYVGYTVGLDVYTLRVYATLPFGWLPHCVTHVLFLPVVTVGCYVTVTVQLTFTFTHLLPWLPRCYYGWLRWLVYGCTRLVAVYTVTFTFVPVWVTPARCTVCYRTRFRLRSYGWVTGTHRYAFTTPLRFCHVGFCRTTTLLRLRYVDFTHVTLVTFGYVTVDFTHRTHWLPFWLYLHILPVVYGLRLVTRFTHTHTHTTFTFYGYTLHTFVVTVDFIYVAVAVTRTVVGYTRVYTLPRLHAHVYRWTRLQLVTRSYVRLVTRYVVVLRLHTRLHTRVGLRCGLYVYVCYAHARLFYVCLRLVIYTFTFVVAFVGYGCYVLHAHVWLHTFALHAVTFTVCYRVVTLLHRTFTVTRLLRLRWLRAVTRLPYAFGCVGYTTRVTVAGYVGLVTVTLFGCYVAFVPLPPHTVAHTFTLYTRCWLPHLVYALR